MEMEDYKWTSNWINYLEHKLILSHKFIFTVLTEWVIRINKKPDPFLQIHYLAGGHTENAISSVILVRALHISPEAQACPRISGEMDRSLF